MKRGLTATLLLIGMIAFSVSAFAQVPREDLIWARTTTNPITLDGVLDEADWAAAEEMVIRFGIDNGLPGSGWKIEGGVLPSDSTYAVLKFLVLDNQLYLGAEIQDESVGGSVDFNRFDGLLMSLKNHADPGSPKPPLEYLYSWWYPDGPTPVPAGYPPSYKGVWATEPVGSPRDSTQIANWEAATVVHGLSSDDSVVDTGYTVEMRFNLTPVGYDVTVPEGDIVEWGISIYDCDWLWPLDAFKLSYNRVWWQSPWGNAAHYDEVHIYARPDVTVDSGPLPYVGPEYFVGEGIGYPAPTIDGSLSEGIWADVDGFDIRYGDDALRQTYPGVGPDRAGQFQPTVNGGVAAVLDPGDATVKMFFQDSTLYMGFDVRDQVVQYVANFERWDGFLITINDRTLRSPDNNLLGRRLAFQVGPTGEAIPQDYLGTLVAEGSAEVAIALKAGTTVDTLGLSADTGYTAEVAIQLTRLGYPPDLGDGTLFMGLTLMDGDSFTPYTDSYGTRTWWFREYEGECCPVWAHLATGAPVTGVGDRDQPRPSGYLLLGNYPNPGTRSTIRFSLPEASVVTLDVFDVMGRLVTRNDLGVVPAGERETFYDGSDQPAGIYLYRLKVIDPASGSLRASLRGKMLMTK